jgi:hypothetical protein
MPGDDKADCFSRIEAIWHQALERPDGELIYFLKGWLSDCSVWRVPFDGGEETKVLDYVHRYGQWTLCQREIYFFAPAKPSFTLGSTDPAAARCSSNTSDDPYPVGAGHPSYHSA